MNRIEEIQALLHAVKEMPDRNILEDLSVQMLKTRSGKVLVDIYDNQPEASCAKFFCTAGSEMDWHIHKVKQIMILIKGKAIFYLNGHKDEIIELSNPGDTITLHPGDKHFAVMEQYTEFYDIKIPSE